QSAAVPPAFSSQSSGWAPKQMTRSLPSRAGGAGRLTDWADVVSPAFWSACPCSAPEASIPAMRPPAKQPAARPQSVRRGMGEVLSAVGRAGVCRQGNRAAGGGKVATATPAAYTPRQDARPLPTRSLTMRTPLRCLTLLSLALVLVALAPARGDDRGAVSVRARMQPFVDQGEI